MKTHSKNPKFQKLLDRVTEAIENDQFDKAEDLISMVRTIVGSNHSSVIELEGRLKRGRILYAKNHQG